MRVENPGDDVVRIKCLLCKHPTNHKVMTEVIRDIGDKRQGIKGDDHYQIVRCLGCDTVSFRNAWWCDAEREWDVDTEAYETPWHQELYPERKSPRPMRRELGLLPSKVASIYRETHDALMDGLSILAAIGIRTLIEVVCVEQGARGPNIKVKIDEMVNKGLLPNPMAELLHKTRVLSNEAAHEGVKSSRSTLDAAIGVAEHLLQSVYVVREKAAPILMAGSKCPPQSKPTPPPDPAKVPPAKEEDGAAQQ